MNRIRKIAMLLMGTLLFAVITNAQPPLRFFSQAGPSPSNETQYGNNPAAGRYAITGDGRIYYELYGQGKPFVVLHGGVYGSIYEMHQFIDSLSKYYQVIAISTSGHGKSDIGYKPVTDEQKSGDVMAVINAVTKDSVSILGFSDGAYTAYLVSSRFPSRVSRLIAIGAGEQIPGLRKVVLDTSEAFHLDSLYWKQQLRLMPEPNRLTEYWKNLSHFYNTMYFSKELFSQIHCPVLVMAGEKDLNAPLATIISAYQMIPNSELSIIPDAPHPVFLVNFSACWTAIQPFLNKQ